MNNQQYGAPNHSTGTSVPSTKDQQLSAESGSTALVENKSNMQQRSHRTNNQEGALASTNQLEEIKSNLPSGNNYTTHYLN